MSATVSASAPGSDPAGSSNAVGTAAAQSAIHPSDAGTMAAICVGPRAAEPAGVTFGEQVRQAFRNLDAVLRAGGSRRALVVNTTVLVADANDFAELNEVFADFCPSEPPAA